MLNDAMPTLPDDAARDTMNDAQSLTNAHALLAERPAPASFVTMAELVASHRRDSERRFSETFGLDHK
ncbi:hypothetical protein [Neoaquamicrobium sediminum]|uniref:hypothetical protein n=1 Tax=Neoaquamicrobium sediminum TaxID=1849104 RepID=UPI004036B1CE